MGSRVQYTRNRLAGAFALLGLTFYALLLPLHLTSQFDRQLFAAEFGTAADTICNAEGEHRTGSTQPGAPASSCPICKGLAAFQLALTPAPSVVVPPAHIHARIALASYEDVAGATAVPARSRGPPTQA
ncbi:DUF2946 domain-containing protein [Hyphomicrobium sp. 1Nfss2.1]|uniref:DUF2946 domain-containing protein n=1 Tax=Hyphomicrobium sp. 1Nfss2.1 TaxID=3413936 RepID=UPI003C7A2D2E